jgi:maltose/moltooligosaccharide transporter
MSFGFLGIQFSFALQNANTSRIFETLGADTSKLALYWLAAPITGLIVQPIIGFYSDRTWHPVWGRRRPYFTIGALAASLALFVMPNSAALWMAVSTLWIMDASINVSMEPFRAFVGDMLPDEQRIGGFAMQSFFIGTGAIIASFLPWILTRWLGVSSKVEAGAISDHVRYSFYIGAAVLLTTVLWTVFRTKEYPPDAAALRLNPAIPVAANAVGEGVEIHAEVDQPPVNTADQIFAGAADPLEPPEEPGVHDDVDAFDNANVILLEGDHGPEDVVYNVFH